MPKVSVIIPTYNRAQYLVKTLNSILNQKYQDFEIIIIDDGSTDNTEEVSYAFLSDKRIKYFKTENKGVSSARNYGLKLANGKFIAFVDSDDAWLPNKLSIQLNILENMKHVDLVFCPVIVNNIAEHKSFVYNRVKVGISDGNELFKDLLNGVVFPRVSTILFRWDKFMIFFDEHMSAGEDHLFYLQLAMGGAKFFGFKTPLIEVLRGHNSLSEDKLFLFIERLKIIDKLSQAKSKLPCSLNSIRSILHLSNAKDVLYVRNIKNKLKLWLFYLKSLAKSFYFNPGNIYIYKHLIKDPFKHYRRFFNKH